MPTTDQRDIEHLLRRTGFTATPDAVAALEGLEWAEAVDAVLDLTDAPDPNSGVPEVGRWPAMPTDWYGDYCAMVHTWFDRCTTTPTPIVEKMTMFWHGHLTSSVSVVPLGPALDQHQLFRREGLGRFDDLVTQIAIDPAMLIYLDGSSSHRWSPNENFPRELLELFCLGVGNYTEDDIRAASRAFTGYRLDDHHRYFYDANWHDDGVKTFMGVSRNWDGPGIIDHILNGPGRPIAARHLVRKLWTFFAHQDPSDAVIDSLATTFSAADLEILPLVRAILLHPDFRSDQSRNGRLRTPMELAVAALTHTGMKSSELRPDWALPSMGQRPFDPPNVDGWPSNEGWISTSTVWGRNAFADRVGHAGANAGLLEGVEALSADDAARTALGMFGIDDPGPATRAALSSFVTETRVTAAWAQRYGLQIGRAHV